MNGKFEEKLAALAFGDLSPEDADQVRAQAMADPDAARTLNMYHSMREGLRDLHDVPEDQLSKERLRDAILGQGLKPHGERNASPFGWLWMPATAAVLAAAFMALRGGASEPQIVVDNSALPDTRVAIKAPEKKVEDAVPPAIKTVASRQATRTASVTSDSSVSRPVRVARRSSAKPAPRRDEKIEFVRFEDGPYYAANRGVADITSTPDGSRSTDTQYSEDAPIVIIEENRDATTGAFRATEVGASNVLIGG